MKPDPLPTFKDEVGRFHEMVEAVGALLSSDAKCSITTEQLLQGPFADTMTHVGQLAMLRRLADSPVAPENFIYADIRADRLHADQPPPARPDERWPEAPCCLCGQAIVPSARDPVMLVGGGSTTLICHERCVAAR